MGLRLMSVWFKTDKIKIVVKSSKFWPNWLIPYNFLLCAYSSIVCTLYFKIWMRPDWFFLGIHVQRIYKCQHRFSVSFRTPIVFFGNDFASSHCLDSGTVIITYHRLEVELSHCQFAVTWSSYPVSVGWVRAQRKVTNEQAQVQYW